MPQESNADPLVSHRGMFQSDERQLTIRLAKVKGSFLSMASAVRQLMERLVFLGNFDESVFVELPLGEEQPKDKIKMLEQMGSDIDFRLKDMQRVV